MNYLAFDIGGTITKYGVINQNYEILERSEYPTSANLGKDHIISSIHKTYDSLKNKYEFKGIAISSAGVIDSDNALVVYANQLMPQIIGINYESEIKPYTGLNVSAENDVNCFALAETLNSKGSFLMITIGTGIGGSIIVDGKVVHGVSNSGGEFGQMIINNNKWESLASMSNLVKRASSLGINVDDGIELFNLYDKGDLLAKEIINDFYNNLAIGIVNLGYIFNPSKIFVGGGITNRSSFLAELGSAIDKLADPFYFSDTSVELAKGLNNGGLLGAVVHHRNKFE